MKKIKERPADGDVAELKNNGIPAREAPFHRQIPGGRIVGRTDEKTQRPVPGENGRRQTQPQTDGRHQHGDGRRRRP